MTVFHFGKVNKYKKMIKNTTFQSLSAIEFEFNHKINGGLKHQELRLKGGLDVISYPLLNKFKDVALTNESAVVLTDSKRLNDVFQIQNVVLYPQHISGTFSLFAEPTPLFGNDNEIKLKDNSFYIGGKGVSCYFNIIPQNNSFIQLTVNGKHCHFTKEYPYDVYLTDEELDPSENYRSLFELYYFKKNRLTFRVITNEGPRFMSYGKKDRKLRCVGLELNEAIVNSYHFIPNFVTSTFLKQDIDVSAKEVKYYTKNNAYYSENDLKIKEQKETPINLLCEFPLKQISEKRKVNLNMALLKTNFTETGTFKSTLSSV